MTDADLIYDALLRAEQRLERAVAEEFPVASNRALAALVAVQTIREEIGNGRVAAAPPPTPIRET